MFEEEHFIVCVQGYKQKDAFIATQMPLPTTVLDLWTLIYDHRSKTIVMMNPLDPLDEVSVLVGLLLRI